MTESSRSRLPLASRIWKPSEYMEWLLTAPQGAAQGLQELARMLTRELEQHVILAGFSLLDKERGWPNTCTQLGHIQMLAATAGGRTMVTLNRADEQVSFVYDADNLETPAIGLQSIHTSISNAADIVREACMFWISEKDPSLLVKQDSEVQFG